MSAGVIDTRNFAADYEQVKKRLRLVQQQISNPDIQIGAGSGGGGSNEFNEVVILNPGSGDDIIIGFDVSPPTGLGASTSTYLEEVYIDASWTAPTDVTVAEYEIELARRTSPGVYDQARVYRTASTSIRLIVPLGGVTYGLRVASINYLGVRSSFTSRIDVTTAVDSTVPPAVSNLAVSAAVNTIVVSFDRLTALEAEDMQNGQGIYRIQISDDDFASLVSEKFTSSNVESFSGLTQGVNYKVRVAAVDPSGNQGPWTTSSNVQPGYVTDSVVEPGTISGDRIVAASITGAEILAGSVDGDRITANTLEANRLTTSTLTAADITLAGGSLIAGTPVTGDGALLNSQGFKLYKDGQLSVNLDALTGDATFTGDVVGSNIFGGIIESPEIIGNVEVGTNLIPNPHFDSNIDDWSLYTYSTGFPTSNALNAAISHVDAPSTTVNGTGSLKVSFTGTSGVDAWRGYASSDLIAVEELEKYLIKASVKTVGFGNQVRVAIGQFKSDGVTSNLQSGDEIILDDYYITTADGVAQDVQFAVVTYAGTAFLRVKIQFELAAASTSTAKYGLVDDVYLVQDKGISEIQFSSGSIGSDGMRLRSYAVAPGYTVDRIQFVRPDDSYTIASTGSPTLPGYIEHYISGGYSSSNRSRVIKINSGGYLKSSGYQNQSVMTIQSGKALSTSTPPAADQGMVEIKSDRFKYSAAGLWVDSFQKILFQDGILEINAGTLDFDIGSNIVIDGASSAQFSSGTASLVINGTNTVLKGLGVPKVEIDSAVSRLIGQDFSTRFEAGNETLGMTTPGDITVNCEDLFLTASNSIWVDGPIDWNDVTETKLLFYGTTYTMGVQSGTLYFRSGSQFAWHRGGVHSDTALDPGTGGTTLMVLNNTGDLLVGKSANNVNVDGTEVRDEGYLISTASAAANIGLWVIHQGSANAVGSAMARFYGTTTLVGSITQGSSANVAYNTTSHGPWKGNIEDLDDDDAIDRLESWRPVSFQWRWDETGNLSELAEPSGPRTHGFIAQELYEVQPHAVTPGSGTEEEHREWLRRRDEAEANGEEFKEMDPFTPWAVDQSALVPDLTAATQAIVRRLRRAEAEISELKAMVS